MFFRAKWNHDSVSVSGRTNSQPFSLFFNMRKLFQEWNCLFPTVIYVPKHGGRLKILSSEWMMIRSESIFHNYLCSCKYTFGTQVSRHERLNIAVHEIDVELLVRNSKRWMVLGYNLTIHRQ